MTRTLSDNLLFVARSLLVLVFIAHLTIVVVGYCILPDQVVAWAEPESGRHGSSYSKELILGLWTMGPCLFLFLGLTTKIKKRKANSPTKYWDREENIVLRSNITKIWFTFFCGTWSLFYTWVMFQWFPVNLSSPRSGDVFWYWIPLPFGGTSLIVLGYLFFVVGGINLTLSLVKRHRERRKHLPDVISSEPQV